MARSFDFVDEKVSEADFFLEKIINSGFGFFEARCYFSAFVASARSITFALQSVMNDVEGFHVWYRRKQEVMRADPITRFFHEVRTKSQHIGINPVNLGTTEKVSDGKHRIRYYFGLPDKEISNAPDADVVTACRTYLSDIVRIVFDCYTDFGAIIDPHQYYTSENYDRLGKTIEEAEEELFGKKGWTAIPDISIEYRWQMIRDSLPGCRIDHLFDKYLGMSMPAPTRLPSSPCEEPGWVYVPSILQRTGNEELDVEFFIAQLRNLEEE